MSTTQKVAAAIAGIMILVALVLVVDRSGVIAWSALLMGVALLAKVWFRPAKSDAGLAAVVALVPALAWAGTLYYVISTWESGEVVEVVIDTDRGVQTARLWVLDIGTDPTVYYDAGPEAAAALLAGKPVQFTRAGQVSTRIPKATPVDALPEAQANQILEAMQVKYGDRNGAADWYYVMLGRSGDRVALVAELVEAS